jgi:hypothetical protein
MLQSLNSRPAPADGTMHVVGDDVYLTNVIGNVWSWQGVKGLLALLYLNDAFRTPHPPPRPGLTNSHHNFPVMSRLRCRG